MSKAGKGVTTLALIVVVLMMFLCAAVQIACCARVESGSLEKPGSSSKNPATLEQPATDPGLRLCDDELEDPMTPLPLRGDIDPGI